MLHAYASERLPPGLFLPLASALALTAGGDRTAWQLGADTALALSLVVQFRIWDDVEDRVHDALDHPSRTVVRAPSIRPFQVAVGCLGAVNAACLSARSLRAAALFGILAATFAVWYHLRTKRTAASVFLLLSKYPAFVAIIALTRTIEHPAGFAISLLIVYAGACVYEAWHDSMSPLRGAAEGEASAVTDISAGPSAAATAYGTRREP